jgi:5S rRNA maturation endonuclease (ribonuclease M5)
MSNVYRYAYPRIQHFQLPRAIIPWLTSITSEELRLLLLVHADAEATSLSDVELSTEEISERAGIHRTNISRVRRALADYGLLLWRKTAGRFIYSICDPTTRTPVPDRTCLMQIDFTKVGAVKLRAYFQMIVESVKETKEGYRGHCPIPGHKDTTPSFFVDLEHASWQCRGCGKNGGLMDLEICMSQDASGRALSSSEAHTRVDRRLRSLGMGKTAKGKLMRPADIIYPYVDEEGEVISEVVRPMGDKSKMYQRQPDPRKPGRYIKNADGCRNVLYNLPAILEADTVIVVEGERDVEALTKLKLLDVTGYLTAVTTNRNGAGSWMREHAETLKRKRVILCGDTNDAGVQHMVMVRASLEALGIELCQVFIPDDYRDVEHFLQTHRPQLFLDLVDPGWLEDVEAEEDRLVAI